MLALALGLFLVTSPAATAAEETVVARIGEREITAAELDEWLSYDLRPGQSVEEIGNKQKASMLHQIVTGMVIADIARKEKFDQRPEVRRRLQLAENNFLTLHYLNDVVAARITATDEEIRKYYEEHSAEFKGKDGKPRPLAEVRDVIVGKLTRDRRREAVDAFVKEAMAKAGAEVDVPALVGNDPHFQ